MVHCKRMKLELPENLNATEQELKVLLAVKLYQDGKISLGQAANVAGYSKRAFIEVLAHHHVAVFDYPATDLEREIE